MRKKLSSSIALNTDEGLMGELRLVVYKHFECSSKS